MSDPFDDPMIKKAEAKQQAQREQAAYEAGKARHKANQDPNSSGGPKSDGYGSMTEGEKENYKRGYRGE